MPSYTNPKDKQVRFNFFLHKDTLTRLKELATFRQTTLSAEIRRALDTYLKSQGDMQ